MKKFLLFIFLTISLIDTHAQAVNSCDGSYSARVVARNEIRIDHTGKKIGTTKIDHSIAGGAFDLAGELFVVYGIPNKVDLRSPQSEYLSIYLMKPSPHILIKKRYGGGVYDIAIGVDPNLIFVSNRFGFDIINIKTMKIKSFDPISEPQFSRQQCKND